MSVRINSLAELWRQRKNGSMKEGAQQTARQAFADAVGMWRTAPSASVRDLVDSATELLVVGVDTPHLRELAGASRTDSMWVIEPILLATIEELGVGDLLDGAPERASLHTMLRRFLARQITLRDLSSWAHVVIGHDGEEVAQPFVVLDDIYDDWESAGLDLDELDRVARIAASEFINAGATDALTALNPVGAAPTETPTPTRRLWWRRRR